MKAICAALGSCLGPFISSCASLATVGLLFKENNQLNKLMCIVGPVGCGKTSLVELFCKENDIQLMNIKSNDIADYIDSKRFGYVA